LVGGRGVAGAARPPNETPVGADGGRRAAASGFKREVTINMLLGGACGKARGWRGHGVRHDRRRKQRPLR
jgi:hypothetical protein